MGKASSAKKVARAARAGGKTSKRERPKLAFPAAVFAVIVLGSLLVVFGRTSRSNSAAADVAPVLNKDHWHAAYGIYVCDKFNSPLVDLPNKPDTNGIHTHGEGVIHIHPFPGNVTGKTEVNLDAGVTSVEGKLPADAPILQAMQKADRFRVTVDGIETIFPLIEADVAGLLALCRRP